MCGIAGIISSNSSVVTKERLQKMAGALAHRGPDGEACWINDRSTTGFGHRRLAIIDLSDAGRQPMHYEDRYTIVYNGEIYNYIELKELLTKKGYRFRSSSDTEVILAAYSCFGADCLSHFDGMFAFAIWDEQEQCLFAARDRFGEKPFYFYFNPGQQELLFASEIKALIVAGAPDTRNDAMLLQYLSSGLITNNADPYQTFYKDISKLPSSHYVTYYPSTGHLSFSKYYDINKEDQAKDGASAQFTEHFKQLFFDSVEKRLRSDVPVGTSLSGGLDSSSVIAVINKLNGNKQGQKAFTASFKDFHKDESMQAGKIAAAFQLEHYLINPDKNDFAQDIGSFFEKHDEPVASASAYAQYKVYKLAGMNNVKVLLDGQGADEILAGYHKYIHWYLQELYASGQHDLLQKEITALKKNNIPFEWGFKNKLAARIPAFTTTQLEKKLARRQRGAAFLTKEFIHDHFTRENICKPVVSKLNDILYFDLYHSLEELLRYADTNSMAWGIEVRLPFLSHPLVECIFNAPSSCKIYEGYTKRLLRISMDDLLSEEIVWRKDKIGFEPPQQSWMGDPRVIAMTEDARQKLVDERILKPAVLKQPVVPHEAYSTDQHDWRYLSAAATLF